MRKAKPNDGGMMEQAIEKASQLIHLLQKENAELKKKIQSLQKELDSLSNKNNDLTNINQKLRTESDQLQMTAQHKQKQIQELKNSLTISQQNLKRKVNTNKQLHQKISVLNCRIKEKSKQSGDQKTKILSLQNQNQYLLKKLKESESKQNQQVKKISYAYQKIEVELKEMQKLKQAFSRKYQELKIDNATLIEAAAQYKQRSIENVQVQLKQLNKPKKQNISPNAECNHIERLIKQSLGVTPAPTYTEQIKQIASFIDYRLNHIQKMWMTMANKIELKQWKKIQNLKDLNFLCQRLNTYISQLVNQAN